MGILQNKETATSYNKNRLETLTDGVFAIAMTLLVTGLNIPKLNGIVTSGSVDSILINLFPDFVHYLIAFALLASFWWASHLRSHYHLSIDGKMSFFTIMTLLFVGLVPFSTNLAGDFPTNSHAVIIFELNLFIIGLLSVVQWNQILKDTLCNGLNADTRMICLKRNEAYIFPLLSFLAILLAIISIPGGIFIYLIVPVYLVLIWLKDTKSLTIKQKQVHKTS